MMVMSLSLRRRTFSETLVLSSMFVALSALALFLWADLFWGLAHGFLVTAVVDGGSSVKPIISPDVLREIHDMWELYDRERVDVDRPTAAKAMDIRTVRFFFYMVYLPSPDN